MSDFGGFISGAAGGAMAGTSLGPVGMGVGAGIGGLLSLFGDSAEQSRQKNYKDYLNELQGIETSTINRGFTEIGGGIQRSMAAARQAATRRFAAMGRTGNIEGMIAPIEARAQQAGGDALVNWYNQTLGQFDRARAGAALEFAQRPIEPSVGQYVMTAGQGIGNILRNVDYINALRQYGQTNQQQAPLGIGQNYPAYSQPLAGLGLYQQQP